MTSIPRAPIDPNHHKGLIIADEITGEPVAVQGTGTDGAINVNVTGGGGGGDVNLTQVGGSAIALGQANMAQSLPVTIANDQPILPVYTDANTSTITIAGDYGIATQFNLTSANAFAMAIVDGSGNQITSFGGGTQYAELTTTAPGTGTLSLGRYKSSPPTLTDGEMYGLQLDSAGNLKVTGSISVGGTTDNSAYTAGASTGTPAFGFYHATIDTVTDGRAAAIAITSKRAQHITPFNSSGTEIGTTSNPIQVSVANTGANATAIKVDGSAVTQPISGTVTANAGTNLNTSALALESGGNLANVASSVVAQSTALGTTKNQLMAASVTTAAPTYTTGNINPLNMSTAGRLRVDGSGVTLTVSATNLSCNVAQVNGVTTLAGNGVSGTGAQRVTIASDSTGQIAPAANATSTGTAIYNNTALSNTKQAVNAAAGNLYGYHIYNPNTTVAYVQLFNLASASVTVGTTPPTAVLAIPGGGWADATPSVPITFATALTIAATTTSTGSTAPSSALLCNIWYK